MDFRSVENLTQCPMKKLKEIYCALIPINTYRSFEILFVIRSFQDAVTMGQGIPHIVSLSNFFIMELSTFKSNWKNGFLSLLRGIIGYLSVWRHPSIPTKSFYSLDPLVLLRLWLRSKGKVGCSADEALGLGGPHSDPCTRVLIHLVSVS